MGKLIVIEGTDGSGKSTQFRLLTQRVAEEGREFQKLVFPQYQEESSALIRMYLGGQFGTKPTDVNAFAASAFYAVDRFASYKMDWGSYYEEGGLILSDRYTTSNAVHQSSKLPEEQLEPFTEWLFDYEYNLLGLPAPTCVIFLDMPPLMSFKMLEKRQGETGDIHELDHGYLIRCHQRALKVCEKYGWHRIPCVEDGKIRSIEEINRDILKIVLKEIRE